MNFSEDEIAAEEQSVLDELMEYSRKGSAMDLRKRYGKPLPPSPEEGDEMEASMRAGGDAPLEDPEIPGVEADDKGMDENGEGADESERHELLRQLLAKMKAGDTGGV